MLRLALDNRAVAKYVCLGASTKTGKFFIETIIKQGTFYEVIFFSIDISCTFDIRNSFFSRSQKSFDSSS